jgi:radical SAM protein with 4Fe4S-binding SPASM domain
VVDTSLSEGEEALFYKMFENISDRMYVEKIKPVYAGVDYKESVQEIIVDRYGNTHEKRMVCPLTFYMLSLWPNGDIVPCDAIYKPVVLGNIKNDTLYSMWHSEILQNFQKMQLKKERNKHKDCQKCCAPDDVSHPLDELDSLSNSLLEIILAKEQVDCGM